MRIRNIKNKKEILTGSNYVINNPEEHKNKWNNLFGNENEIHIEIGCGKGTFLYEMAKNNKEINYIGIERIDTVLALAVQNFNEREKLNNLKIINYDALKIDNIFGKEISKIYLNFSDPWPKKRHEKRRLTSLRFLEKYDIIFKSDKNKEINLKTDNINLFEYSIISLSNYGYKIKDISLDLHKREDIFNIKTEYETKFSNKGYKINYLNAVKDK